MAIPCPARPTLFIFPYCWEDLSLQQRRVYVELSIVPNASPHPRWNQRGTVQFGEMKLSDPLGRTLSELQRPGVRSQTRQPAHMSVVDCCLALHSASSLQNCAVVVGRHPRPVPPADYAWPVSNVQLHIHETIARELEREATHLGRSAFPPSSSLQNWGNCTQMRFPESRRL